MRKYFIYLGGVSKLLAPKGDMKQLDTGFHKYVVWQKSNKNYFLLSMNFIPFTNQGHSIQNSSLGQLHSDGGIVSIVRSSAGRLLLVYL